MKSANGGGFMKNGGKIVGDYHTTVLKLASANGGSLSGSA
jgi:hypothetical protein